MSFAAGGYTIPVKQKTSESNYNAFFKTLPLNEKLEGIWTNSAIYLDYGKSIDILEIFDDSRIICTPESERVNSPTYYGKYGVISDTLLFKFDNIEQPLWMKYYFISENKIRLKNLPEINAEINSEMPHNGRSEWIKAD